MTERSFDVVIAGGGLAGSALGGVLARSGLGVLVVEKEDGFRDRIRGELSFPWGHSEALRAGLGEPLDSVGAVPLPEMGFYEDGRRVDGLAWNSISIDGLPAIGFSHPRLQEVMLGWAESQGATVLRPAKVVGVADGHGDGGAIVSATSRGATTEYHARLVVGADGKTSGVRRWLQAQTVTDPEHHRFGGLLLSGVRWDDTFAWASTPANVVGWFLTGADSCRVYIRLTAERVHETGAGRSPEAFIAFAARAAPEGTFDGANPAGPLGFFANSCTWASHVTRGPMVLVGDAAGALDPSQGLGTSLLFRDVRLLSELLLADRDWQRATAEFAKRREAYYDVLRAYDRWLALIEHEEGPEGARRRELHAAAREADPTLGGFATLEACGPDGLTADEAARRGFFGEPPA
ncbi:FAD-dependent oxidoreductase [Nocardioides taihuensis]|uniref:FAD-dependent oxidoreductase n=1 Tax=Nocardioides taihuensis TaxID=1835606 RepID=A0ABW0BHU1_9ACTN